MMHQKSESSKAIVNGDNNDFKGRGQVAAIIQCRSALVEKLNPECTVEITIDYSITGYLQ